MTSEGLGRFLKVTLQTCVLEKFPLVSMGGLADGLACADPGASGNYKNPNSSCVRNRYIDRCVTLLSQAPCPVGPGEILVVMKFCTWNYFLASF
jgi:hypothetical protein